MQRDSNINYHEQYSFAAGDAHGLCQPPFKSRLLSNPTHLSPRNIPWHALNTASQAEERPAI